MLRRPRPDPGLVLDLRLQPGRRPTPQNARIEGVQVRLLQAHFSQCEGDGKYLIPESDQIVAAIDSEQAWQWLPPRRRRIKERRHLCVELFKRARPNLERCAAFGFQTQLRGRLCTPGRVK